MTENPPTDPHPEVAHIATDPHAFDAFYRHHIDAIGRFVARRVADPAQAADLTADIFLAAIDSAATYHPRRGQPRAWLYGVARNVVAAHHRRRGREQRALNQISGRRLLDGDDLARIEARIDAHAQARRLYTAMDRLSDKERAVLELVALEDMTPRQVAAALDITPITVRVRLHRARRLLRHHLTAPETPDLPAAPTRPTLTRKATP